MNIGGGGMDFSGGAGQPTGNELIPKGTLAWAFVNVRSLKASQTGGAYLDVEVTIADGPFARRKIFEMIGDPMNDKNSESYRQFGRAHIARILECGRNAGPHNPAGYQIRDYNDLSGLKVGIEVGIAIGKNGYDDKNVVREWLTPNPQSTSGNKGFLKLVNGGHQQPVPAGFGQAPSPVFQAPQAAPQPNWGQGATNAHDVASNSNVSQEAAQHSGLTGIATFATANITSPSNAPGDPPAPGWFR